MSDNSGSDSRGAIAVALLGVTQVIGYGTTYYCFSAMADSVCAELGWSRAFYFGTLSAGLVTGGLFAAYIGRAFDRFGAARVMSLGSLLSAMALLMLSLSHATWAFLLSMMLLQFAGDLMLYDAAFTTLVQVSPRRSARRITYLTLIAGFASTIFWPFTGWLVEHITWRETLQLFAAFNICVCLPVHLYLAGGVASIKIRSGEGASPMHVAGSLPQNQFRTAMMLMSLGFMLSSITLSAVLATMVLTFQDMGFGASSLAIGMLFGPAQVLVRFGHMLVGENAHPLRTTIFALVLMPIGLSVGLVFSPSIAGAVVMVVLIGLCSGLKSIVQGALPLHLFGSEGYGARLGFISSFRLVAAALAPFGFSFVTEKFGIAVAVSGLIAIAAAGVGCFLLLKLRLGDLQANARAATEPHA